jgi:acyl-CoA thioester hydrolase
LLGPDRSELRPSLRGLCASITLAQEVRRGADVLVKAEVRVAFISEGRAQPIPKALRTLLKADAI